MNPTNAEDQDSQIKIIYEQERIIKELNSKIAELEETIANYKIVVKELQTETAAIKRDRDECVKLLQSNSMSPLFYASTQKRDEFWKVIHENIAFLKEKNKFENESLNKLEEKDDEILKQRVMIEHLRKEIANYQVTQETNQKLRSEIENLYDHLLKEQAKNKDLTIKIMSLEKQIEISEQKEKETAKHLELMDTTVKRKIETFNEEQKSILESIKSIKERGHYLKNQGYNTVKPDIKYFSSDTDLDQFIMRLRTTSVHSEKFAEVLDILTDMLKSAKGSYAEIEGTGSKSYQDQRRMQAYLGLTKKLEDPQSYRLFLKALQSSSIKVIISCEALLFEIGNYSSRVQEYFESGSLPILSKTLKNINEPILRTNTLTLLQNLAAESPKVSQELYNNGLSFFLSAQIRQNFKEAHANSFYLLKLLNLTGTMIKDGFGKRELIQDDLISIYFYLLKESDIIDIKKSVLKLIPFLSEEQANRLKIYEKGDFTTLWNTFIGGNTNPDKSLLHLSIEALVRFVSDEKISLLFMTSEKLFETFDVLSKNLNLASAMPPTTKAAAIEMVSQLLRSGTKNVEFEKQVLRNDLLKLLLNQLKEGDSESQKQSLKALIYLRQLIFKYADKFSFSLKALAALLSSKDKDVIILALKFMDILTEQPQLLDGMVKTGITSVIASFFVHDPKEIDPSVLAEAGYLLLKFQDSQLAVKEMVDAQTFLTILPLVTLNDTQIRKFWHYALVEFCSHKEFRGQLENQPIYITFIKKVFEDFDTTYSEQLCFALRVLLQSRLLTNYIADEPTIHNIYNFIYEFSKEANNEFLVYIIEIMALLAQTSEGHEQLVSNNLMIDILNNQIQKEDENVSNTTAKLIIYLLQDTSYDTSLLKETIFDGLSIYVQSRDPLARSFASTIISLLKKDPAYADKIQFVEKQILHEDTAI